MPTKLVGVLGGHAGRSRYPNGGEVEYTTLVFQGGVVGGALHAVDGEALAFRYFALTELPDGGRPYPVAWYKRAADGVPTDFNA